MTAVTVVFVEFARDPVTVTGTIAIACAPRPRRRALGGAADPGAAGPGRPRAGRRRRSRWRRTTPGATPATAATERAVAVPGRSPTPPRSSRRVGTADPTAVLQPFAEQVRARHRRRLRGGDGAGPDPLHATPTPARSASRSSATSAARRRARSFTQESTGTLGPSMRAVVPGRCDGGEVVALVSVGITIAAIDRQLRDDLALIAARRRWRCSRVGLVGAWLVEPPAAPADARPGRARDHPDVRVLHGGAARRPRGTAAARHRRPGAAGQRRGAPAARPARRRGRPAARRPRPAPRRWSPRRSAATAEADDIYLAGDRVLVVSSAPAPWQGREVGAVVTLRDHTELRAVTGELDVVRGLTESLRAQNHEAANRLHTVVSLIEMGRPDEAVEFATEELAGRAAAHRPGRRRGRRPGASRRCCSASRPRPPSAASSSLVEGDLPRRRRPAASRDLVTVLGNLVDNAFDARGRPRRRRRGRGAARRRRRRARGRRSATAGRASTTRTAAHVLERGWTTKALRRAAAAASGWPWSARSRAGTAARSTIGRSRARRRASSR